MWPETQTPSQALLQSDPTIIISQAPTGGRECLFCLEQEYVSDEEPCVAGSVDAAHKSQPPHRVLDYGDLFSCSCSVFAHGKCLHRWLLLDNRCPMCKEDNGCAPPRHVVTTVENIHSTPAQENGQSAAPLLCDIGRVCCYCCAGLGLVFLVMHNKV